MLTCACAQRSALAITSAEGRRTATSELKGSPPPDGQKTSVWSSTARHRPAAAGTRVGCLPPNRRETGSEKVSLIGASGFARTFGPGETSTTGRVECGNQVTRTGAPSRLPRPHGRGERDRTCRGLCRQRHRAARHGGARDGDPIDRGIEPHAHGPAMRDRHPAVTDRRDRCPYGQRLTTRRAQRPALPARTTNHNRHRDPLTRGHLHARSQPAVRDDKRNRAAVSSPRPDADERTGERLQLYARERRPVRDQPHVREHPDQHGPGNRDHDYSKAEPAREARWSPMRPHSLRTPDGPARSRQSPTVFAKHQRKRPQTSSRASSDRDSTARRERFERSRVHHQLTTCVATARRVHRERHVVEAGYGCASVEQTIATPASIATRVFSASRSRRFGRPLISKATPVRSDASIVCSRSSAFSGRYPISRPVG